MWQMRRYFVPLSCVLLLACAEGQEEGPLENIPSKVPGFEGPNSRLSDGNRSNQSNVGDPIRPQDGPQTPDRPAVPPPERQDQHNQGSDRNNQGNENANPPDARPAPDAPPQNPPEANPPAEPPEQPEPAPQRPPEANPNPQPVPPQAPREDPEPDPCTAVGLYGVCDGDVAVWCDQGTLTSLNCRSELNASCGFVDQNTGFFCQSGHLSQPQPPSSNLASPQGPPSHGQASCGQIDYLGVCDGDIARWCSQDGQLMARDCMQADGTRCEWIDNSSGYYCGQPAQQQAAPADPPPNHAGQNAAPPAQNGACGHIDYQGACEGNTAIWCDNDEIYSLDCDTSGEVCGWAGDQLGYYCQPT